MRVLQTIFALAFFALTVGRGLWLAVRGRNVNPYEEE